MSMPFEWKLISDQPRPSHAPRFEPHAELIQTVSRETEKWLRLAIERGPGWNVWRGHPDDGLPYLKVTEPVRFVIAHGFALVPPGENAPGSGLLFTQPDLTEGERARLLAGRFDWREQDWEDHCGIADCDHECCKKYWLGIEA